MTNDSYLDARACRRRQASPVALAACAFIAAMALLVAPAAAAPEPKVQICHIPPANPEDFHTIKVSENALSAHLAHGDLAGACDELCAVLCDDGNACTKDDTGDCEDNGCPTAPEAVDCNDGNACTADSCAPATGCEYIALTGTTCTVGSPSTCEQQSGVCDSVGACQPGRVPGCCLTTAECEAWDTNLCTNEECIDTECVTTSTVGCQTDACNISVCIPETGQCTEDEPIVCPNPECHVNGCDPETGCYSNVIDGCCISHVECDDQNNCTTDTCLGVEGCVNVECAGGDACNVLVDCDPLSCAPQTVAATCEDDGDLCTAESCVDGLGCVSDPVDCAEGEACNPDTGNCEPDCFSLTQHQGLGAEFIPLFIQDCINRAGCPVGVCEATGSAPYLTLTEQCIGDGDPAACDEMDQLGRNFGCTNICPLAAPEGPDVLLCGGSACARYDAGIGSLNNPQVRSFIDDYYFVHPTSGTTLGFNFGQTFGTDGFLWATTRGNRFDNFTDVWVYDVDLKQLVSCNAFGDATGGSCEDSALGTIGSVSGSEVTFGEWATADVVATHVPGGIYGPGEIGFWHAPRRMIIRLAADASFQAVVWRDDMIATCSSPGLVTDNLDGNAHGLAAAPPDPSDPTKEVLFYPLRYHAGGTTSEHWMVKFDVQSGTCSEIAVLNSEAGSNTIPPLSDRAIDGEMCAACGIERIRVATDGTIFFLIRQSQQAQVDDGIWRMADTDGDDDIDGDDVIFKIIDWEDTENEIADFAIGPHDGRLYLLVAGRAAATVDRVTIYEPDIALGDAPLGTVFNLDPTHGTQTRIEFFPLNGTN